MFGECHAHMIMDGINYKKAVEQHCGAVDDAVIRSRLEEYKKRDVRFIRDGGDFLNVSKRAKEIAPEYNIDYRTPVFAIHRKGRYGSIVGRAFQDSGEFRTLVLEAKEAGADFIKIMTTGILDFQQEGAITGTPLTFEEIREMVRIAHGEGLAVMSHTNGTRGVLDAVNAGVDSIEHGNFMGDDAIALMAEKRTIWVPTLSTIRNLLHCDRYDRQTIESIVETNTETVKKARKAGVIIALGSDAGAYMVKHGQGICDEYKAFQEIFKEDSTLDLWLADGEKHIKERFRRS